MSRLNFYTSIPPYARIILKNIVDNCFETLKILDKDTEIVRTDLSRHLISSCQVALMYNPSAVGLDLVPHKKFTLKISNVRLMGNSLVADVTSPEDNFFNTWRRTARFGVMTHHSVITLCNFDNFQQSNSKFINAMNTDFHLHFVISHIDLTAEMTSNLPDGNTNYIIFYTENELNFQTLDFIRRYNDSLQTKRNAYRERQRTVRIQQVDGGVPPVLPHPHDDTQTQQLAALMTQLDTLLQSLEKTPQSGK